jgi:hypothetical protein
VVAVNEWNESVDPDWRKKVSEWDTVNGLPIMLPSEDGTVSYITIPVAYGIKPIRVAADYAHRMTTGDDVGAGDAVGGMFAALLDSYNPIGGTDFLSAVTPSVLDLPIELARNQKWSGAAIRPDFDPYAPNSIKYFDSLEDKWLGRKAIGLTQKLAGWGVELSPADLVYAYEQYTSGAGRFASKVATSIGAGIEGKVPPMSEFPFVSRFYKERGGDEIFDAESTAKLKALWGEDRRDSFYLRKKSEEVWDSIAELPLEERKAKLKEIAAADPDLAEKVMDQYEAEKYGLQGVERSLKSAPVDVRAQYIAGEVKDLSKEERKEVLKNYAAKKILTDSVMDELEILLKEPEKIPDQTSVTEVMHGVIRFEDGSFRNVRDMSQDQIRATSMLDRFSGFVEKIKERIPFLETNFEKAVKEDLKSQYAFTDEALAILDEVDIRERADQVYAPFVKRSSLDVEADHDHGGGNSGVAGTYRMAKSETRMKVARKLWPIIERLPDSVQYKVAGAVSGEEISLNDLHSSTLAHEGLHAIFASTEFDTKAFLSDWEQAKNDPDVAPLLEDIEMTMDESGLYSRVSPATRANEYYAFLGERTGMAGLRGVPPQLRSHYEGVFKEVPRGSGDDIDLGA